MSMNFGLLLTDCLRKCYSTGKCRDKICICDQNYSGNDCTKIKGLVSIPNISLADSIFFEKKKMESAISCSNLCSQTSCAAFVYDWTR